ncbi:MAG: alpha-ketoacid dehydrogenase subunit beta [Chlamydiia bacterium]|nr:alpha-ketoacid dehydrogenase subunit beta [Chlamydiia bacterium]
MIRELSYADAIREGTEQLMEADRRVIVMGLGVTDPKGIFGTTSNLHRRFGPKRAFDLPVAENSMTGVAIGSALAGMRPILTHQRLDFMLLSIDQLFNNAAKWHYMFAEQQPVPLVIRALIGRGWGQGPQHSQSLHSLFAHIPGLKVALPATPADAKGLLIAAVNDPNPVLLLEHRWLYGLKGPVPEQLCSTPLGKARVARSGSAITLVSWSYMLIESLRAAELLKEEGIDAEVIDLRSLSPLDTPTLLHSLAKTGHLVIVDGDWEHAGFAGEVTAQAVEKGWDLLLAPPKRVCWPHVPCPTSWVLAKDFYPRAVNIAEAVCEVLGHPAPHDWEDLKHCSSRCDTPDPSFTGPF